MTAEQLEELLKKVTQWPPVSGHENAHDATLITIAPSLARRVLAAESAEQRLLDAASEYLKKQYGIGALSNPIDRERILTAYREASK